MPDAVVETEQRSRQQAGVCLWDVALFHAAHQEGRPGELEIASTRARELTGLLLPSRLTRNPDQALLGDQQAVAENFLFGQVISGAKDRNQPVEILVVLARDPLEVALE